MISCCWSGPGFATNSRSFFAEPLRDVARQEVEVGLVVQLALAGAVEHAAGAVVEDVAEIVVDVLCEDMDGQEVDEDVPHPGVFLELSGIPLRLTSGVLEFGVVQREADHGVLSEDLVLQRGERNGAVDVLVVVLDRDLLAGLEHVMDRLGQLRVIDPHDLVKFLRGASFPLTFLHPGCEKKGLRAVQHHHPAGQRVQHVAARAEAAADPDEIEDLKSGDEETHEKDRQESLPVARPHRVGLVDHRGPERDPA